MSTFQRILTTGLPMEQWELLVLGFGLTAVLSWPAILVARHYGFVVRVPDSNPYHQKGQKYKVGGVLAMLVALSLISVAVGFKSPWRSCFTYVGGLTLIGVLDDFHPLTPGWKIVLQAPLALQVSLTLPLPVWVDPGLTRVLFQLVWLVVLTNAFNILDVADGLLPGLSTVLLWVLGVLVWSSSQQRDLAVFGIVAAAATLGLLPWNAHRGKLILGDSGSLPLGGLAALMLLYVDWTGMGLLSRIAFFMLVLPPLFEVVWVSIKRIRRKIPPWRGSPHHFVYWLSQRGLPKRWAVIVIVAFETVPAVFLLVSHAPLWTALVPLGALALLTVLASIPGSQRTAA